jgi:DNA polymerase elongation subunit (family B)
MADICFSYSWFLDNKETDITSIRLYGLDKNNKNICLRIDDFTPYVYIELPVEDAKGTKINWGNNIQVLASRLDEILGRNKPLKKKLIYKHKLYGAEFDNKGERKLFPYLLCSFSNKNDYKNLGFIVRKPIYIFSMGQIKLKMHEQDASPILQLVCCRDIPTAGWIKFKGEEVKKDEKITLCDREYIVSYKNIASYEKNTVAKPKLMGFDIEVNSTNPSAMPQSSKQGDKIFQISCVFAREGCKEEDYDIYLLTLGEVESEQVGENVTAYMYETEADLLQGFTDLVNEENPNIIVGYNILKFDVQYMIDRARSPFTFNCMNKFDKIGFHKFNHAEQEKIKWSSSAFKNQEFDYLDAEGRVFVDLLPLVQRDYKLNNYQLKTVSTEFLKDTKDDLSAKGIFKCYRIGIEKEKDGTYGKKAIKAMSLVGKYCIKDSVLVVKLMEKLQTWVGLCEMAKTTNISIFDVFTQGQQKKVYSQIYKYAMYNNIVVEKDAYITKENERYVGAHVFPPIPGIYERVLPFDFCLSGDTLITMSNGISKRIDSLHNNQLVFGFNKDINGYENYSSVHGLQKKGVRDTVKIYFQDGSSIVSTPEHKFMLDNGEWCEAKDLKNKYVKAGIKYPEDNICTLEKDWGLKVEGYDFNMKNDIEREKSLAFARMIGFILADGSIYEYTCNRGYIRKSCEADFGTLFDALAFKRDISLFSDVDVIIRKRDDDEERNKKGVTQNITLPPNISRMIHSLEGIVIGKRSTRILSLPNFILDDNCPLSIIREFLGGLFGGDGTAPCLCKDKRFGYIKFKWTIIEKYVYSLENTIKNIQKLLSKFNIVSNINKPLEVIKSKDSNKRILLKLTINNDYFILFSSKITFLYSIEKAYKLHISTLYKKFEVIFRKQLDYIIKTCKKIKRLNNEIIRKEIQKLKKIEPLVFEHGLMKLKNRTIKKYKGSKIPISEYDFPCPNIFLNEIDIIELYNENYLIKTDYTSFPNFRQKVIDVREHEPTEVFDIEVESVHNFLANGITVSNCSLYPTTIIAYNIDYSTLVTDSNIPDEKCHIMDFEDHISCIHDPKVIKYNKLSKYLDDERKILKDLRTERDNKLNKHIKDEFIEKINKKVEELKPFIKERSTIKKTISKNPMCEKRYYRFLKEPKGVIPTILQNLLDARKNTRKEIKSNIKLIKDVDENKVKEIDELNKVLDKRQLAYKICANSVSFTTPIPCRINGLFVYKTIEELSKGDWKRINEEQEISSPIDGLEVWSDLGFTNAKYIMRHPNDEDMYVINTPSGIVECTGDHSLLRIDRTEVRPRDLNIGDELLHFQYNLPKDTPLNPFLELKNKKIKEIECNNIFEANFEYRFKFILNYFSKKQVNYNLEFFNLQIENEIEAASIFYLLKSVGFNNIILNFVNNKIYQISYCKNKINNNNSITSIKILKKNNIEYVYDIETENHHFAAGIGNMIVHNSMYGIMGVKKGLLPFMPGAMCTTYMGRVNIEKVADTITKKYKGKLVYGDTDSNYINFPHLKTAEESWDYAIKVSEEVSALFPPPISLAFEEAIYWQFFILTKKRYMYRACGRDGIVDNKIGKKGVLLARRDNALIIRLIYEKIISMIFDKVSRNDILYYILEEINRICSNSAAYKEFVITKSVGDVGGMQITSFKDEKGVLKAKIGNYIVKPLPKNKKERESQLKKKGTTDEIEYYKRCLPAVVQLAEKMRNRGQRVDVGTRLEYLITDIGVKNAKQYEKLENIDYFLTHNDVLKIDFIYYIKLMINPFDDILNVGFNKNIEDGYKFKKDFMLEQYNFRFKVREKLLNELKDLFRPKIVFV